MLAMLENGAGRPLIPPYIPAMATSRLDGGTRVQRWVVGALAIGILTAFALPLARRGIVLSDEGFLLQQALDMLGGAVLYRDLVTVVAPGAWLAVAGLFGVFEPSVFATRMLGLAAYLVMMLAAYRIVARVSGHHYALAAAAVLMVLTVWAFPSWTLAWYSPFAICFALSGVERLLAWNRRRASRDIFVAGLLLALSIACKQNYGALALMGAIASIVAIHWSETHSLRRSFGSAARDFLPLAAGGLLVTLPLLCVFAAVGALGDLVESVILQPLRFSQTSGIAYLPASDLWNPTSFTSGVSRLTYGSIPLNIVTLPGALRGSLFAGLVAHLHALLFWLPLPILMLGGVLSCLSALGQGRRDDELLILWLTGGGLFLGVFPRADFIHLMGVYAPLVVLAAVSCERLLGTERRQQAPWARLARVSVIGLLGLYGAVAAVWYLALMRDLSAPLDIRRGGVQVSEREAASILRWIDDIRARTSIGEAVLSVPDLAMLNFLTERPFVGGTHEMYEHMIGADQGQGIIDAAEAQEVRIAALRFNDFFSHRVGLREYAPPLAAYLRSHFKSIYYRDDENFMLLERRESPLATRPAIDVLEDCDAAESDSIVPRQIRSHLLFDSLYHRVSPQRTELEPRIRTTCRVRVPVAATLHLELGYRPPEWAEDGTTLTAFMGVRSPATRGRIEVLLRKTFEIDAEASSRPYVEELRVDLSHLAGQEIELIFETGGQGPARARPGEYLGYSMVWQDPRIVSMDE